jgi:hypothetical protein
MRFVHTSSLSLFSLSIVSVLSWACASKDASSTFSGSTGSGNATGPGSGPGSGPTGSGPGSGPGSTGTGIHVTTGSGGSGGGGSVDRDANCGKINQGTKQIPIDIFIMQDKSGSMECPAADDMCSGNIPMPLVHPTRWEATTMALNTFVTSPQANGIAVGLGLFSPNRGGNNNAECVAATYATPVVPIAPLPGNAAAFTAAVNATMPAGDTPTTPALQGALDYARAYTMAQMGQRTAAVVLVTDGLPSANNCNPRPTIPAAAMAAMNAFNGTPQIKTFVIGMGATASLEEIALAGSGGMTHFIPTAGDVVGTLTAALTSISGMVTCSYAIPPGSNPALVNVQITVGQTGMPTDIGKVTDLAACGPPGGWYYDNNITPTQIVLCPQTCDPVQMTADSGVEVLYGCPSEPPK